MRIPNLMLVPALAALAVSCYADLSTEAGASIPEIVISGLEDNLYISFGDEISLSPEVSQEGRTQEDFTYLWEMDLLPGKVSDRVEVGDGKDITLKIANTPSETPYVLSLTVTDNETGVSALHGINVYVSNSLGEGLLVAHTKDGGQTSDLDLVTSPSVSYGFEGDEPKYVRNLYSLVNGAPLEGRIQAMSPAYGSSAAKFDISRVMVGTEDHIYALDPLTYEISASDSDLMTMSSTGAMNTTALFNFAASSTAAVINGDVYGYITFASSAYSKIAYPNTPGNIFADNNTSHNKLNQGRIVVFDSNVSKFYSVLGWTISSGGGFSEVTPSFSISLSGAESMAAGGMKNLVNAFVMKTADSKYYLCTLDLSGNTPLCKDYEILADDIEDAVSFTFCDNTDIFYFATESKVYANYISGGMLNYRAVSWSPDSPDEKITSITHYKQAWYGAHQYGETDYEFMLDTNRTQVIITTWNEQTGEGKIYLKGFNVSTGLFTMKDNGTFSGFGEILAITPTFR